MANSEIVTLIVTTTAEFFTYMFPIIGVLSAIVFVVTWLYDVTIGLGRKTFRN